MIKCTVFSCPENFRTSSEIEKSDYISYDPEIFLSYQKQFEDITYECGSMFLSICKSSIRRFNFILIIRIFFSSARQLSCGHCFHGSCLRLWLEQDASCPTCRRKLNCEDQDETANEQAGPVPQEAPVWQFNLRRFHRWLPALQVTVNYDLQPVQMNDNRLQAAANELLQVPF